MKLTYFPVLLWFYECSKKWIITYNACQKACVLAKRQLGPTLFGFTSVHQILQKRWGDGLICIFLPRVCHNIKFLLIIRVVFENTYEYWAALRWKLDSRLGIPNQGFTEAHDDNNNVDKDHQDGVEGEHHHARDPTADGQAVPGFTGFFKTKVVFIVILIGKGLPCEGAIPSQKQNSWQSKRDG